MSWPKDGACSSTARTRMPCKPGDLLFVAANVTHRFEDFTEDFGVWVMFYGPENGEK